MDSSIDTTALADAREIIRRAEAAEEAKKKAKLTELLQNEVDGLRKAEAEHAPLLALLKPQRDAIAAGREKIRAASERVNDLLEEKPDYADLLPNDPVVIAWKLRLRKLEADRDEAIVELKALPDPNDTVALCNRYEGPNGIIKQHKFVIANLRRQLEGSSGKAFVPTGGVFGVR